MLEQPIAPLFDVDNKVYLQEHLVSVEGKIDSGSILPSMYLAQKNKI